MINYLDKLALKNKTDKASNLHNYTRWYYKHLPDHLHYPFIKLFEIGVSTGNSLRMWKEYYPHAFISGLDINDSEAIDGTKIFKGDQKDPVVLKSIVEEIVDFDVIIDDGSHKWEDQIASFKILWPSVKPGGVYVIEDLHTSYFMEFGEPGGLNTMDFLHLIMNEVNMYGEGGLGDCRNLQGYEQIKNQLSIYQTTIESMTFYPSIVFIRKSLNAD